MHQVITVPSSLVRRPPAYTLLQANQDGVERVADGRRRRKTGGLDGTRQEFANVSLVADRLDLTQQQTQVKGCSGRAILGARALGDTLAQDTLANWLAHRN